MIVATGGQNVKNGSKSERTAALPTRPEFEELIRQANEGVDTALEELRRVLDQQPQIWQKIGDMGGHALQSLYRLISGGNKLVTESLQRRTAELRLQLEGPAPTPLERLAVQRVVICMLEVEYATTAYPEPRGKSLGQQRHILRYKDSAQRRFDASMKSLLLIRSLLLAEGRQSTGEGPVRPPRSLRCLLGSSSGSQCCGPALRGVDVCHAIEPGLSPAQLLRMENTKWENKRKRQAG